MSANLLTVSPESVSVLKGVGRLVFTCSLFTLRKYLLAGNTLAGGNGMSNSDAAGARFEENKTHTKTWPATLRRRLSHEAILWAEIARGEGLGAETYDSTQSYLSCGTISHKGKNPLGKKMAVARMACMDRENGYREPVGCLWGPSSPGGEGVPLPPSEQVCGCWTQKKKLGGL